MSQKNKLQKKLLDNILPNKNISIPTVDFWRNEITITSSYGAAPDDLEEALELIKNKKINVKDMITHTFPLEKIQEGFRIVTEAKESLKVIVEQANKKLERTWKKIEGLEKLVQILQ